MVNFYSGLEAVEKGFNLAACVPGLGLITSPLRQKAGKAEALIGATMVVFGAFAYGVNLLRSVPNNETDLKSRKVMAEGAELILQGALNVIRGKAEGYGSILLGFPNGGVVLGHWFVSGNFGGPAFKYGSFFGDRSYIAPNFPRIFRP